MLPNQPQSLQQSRFALETGKPSMKAVVTIGSGGYEQLEYADVPIPQADTGELLLQVLAAGVNATDINTRLGWYSPEISTGTDSMTPDELDGAQESSDGGWNKPTPFPLIQGTDCCGRVVLVPSGGDQKLLGARVLVRPCMRTSGFQSMETIWMGTDFDGSFAQFLRIPANEAFPVDCDWNDVELGSVPCAFGTAENMLQRSNVSPGEHIIITGASGGVGSAAVQLAKRRGAVVTAMTSSPKMAAVRSIGADHVIARDNDPAEALGQETVDVVVDNVAGPGFSSMLELLKRGGRYVSSGAIGGPIVSMDMRRIYLKDLTLIGCTAWNEKVFPNLVSIIERGEIQPLVSAAYSLDNIEQAQREFSKKQHTGKIVLVPPPLIPAQEELFPSTP